LKEIVKKTIKNSSKTICFVSNREGNLIIQSSSPDFDTTTLYYLYEKIYQSSKTPEHPLSNSKFINAGSKLLYMLIEDIGNFHPNFKNLLFFSETLKENDLNEFVNEIEKDLSHIYK
ncbi:MAG: hypothetical protein KAT57_11805, partial [Candidatus Lokiarchaeota archaeon]|nr:hypothetical protein [Candidatus Lokiarchaeota archaeon]